MTNLFKLVFEGQELNIYTHDGVKIPCIGTTTVTQTAVNARDKVHVVDFDLTTDQFNEQGEMWSAHENLNCIKSVSGDVYHVESCKVDSHLAGYTFIFKVKVLAEYDHVLTSKMWKND